MARRITEKRPLPRPSSVSSPFGLALPAQPSEDALLSEASSLMPWLTALLILALANWPVVARAEETSGVGAPTDLTATPEPRPLVEIPPMPEASAPPSPPAPSAPTTKAASPAPAEPSLWDGLIFTNTSPRPTSPQPIERKTARTAADAAAPPRPPASAMVGTEKPAPPNLTSYNDFGEIGLIQIPSARMAPSGEIATGASYADPYTRFFVSAQILPWLEGTFRYTSIANVAYNASYPNSDYKDRAFDLKIRLMKEGEYLPDLSVGLRDIGGTGLFSGEYLVASRRWHRFDFTAGMGWGYLGDGGSLSNPLGLISHFDQSRGSNSQIGGVNGAYFQGKTVGLFGGVQYETEIEGLRLFAEYDGHDYDRERYPLKNKANLPVNIGAHYDFGSGLSAAVGFERGNTVMFRGALQFNTDSLSQATPPSPPPVASVRDSEVKTAMVASQQQAQSTAFLTPLPDLRNTAQQRALAKVAGSMGRTLQPGDVRLVGSEAIIVLDARQEAPRNDALAQAAYGLISGGTPTNDGSPLQTVTFMLMDQGVPVAQQTLAASDLYRSMALTGHPGALMKPTSHAWDKALSQGQPLPSLADALTDALDRMGVAPLSVAIRGREVLLEMPLDTTLPPVQMADAASRVGSSARDIDQLVFLLPNRHGSVTRMAYLTHSQTDVLAMGALVDEPTPPTVPHPELPPLKVSAKAQKSMADAIFADLKEAKITGLTFDIQNRTAILEYQQTFDRNPAIPMGRATRILARYVPAEVERFVLIPTEGGLPVSRVSVMRSDMERLWAGSGAAEDVWQHTRFDSATASATESPTGTDNDDAYPSFTWSLNPRWRQHVGGGDNFYAWQLWAEASGTVNLTRKLKLSASIGQDVANTFDSLKNAPTSNLPHVRSDVVRYMQGNSTWVNNFYVNYNETLAPDLYGRLAAGYLEEMYAGLSGEVLYRPHGEPWAIGMDLSRVRKRGFNRDFELLDYEVTTGGPTLYYQLPWYGIGTSLHIGQYLAGDRGATFEIWREFAGGVTIGAWASKTDVSAEQFGEGSFDKGIRLSVPLDMITGTSSRTTLGMAFSPLTKDGAQQVGVPGRLYPLLNSQSDQRIGRGWTELSK